MGRSTLIASFRTPSMASPWKAGTSLVGTILDSNGLVLTTKGAGESYGSKIGPVSSSMEEMRAEAVALYCESTIQLSHQILLMNGEDSVEQQGDSLHLQVRFSGGRGQARLLHFPRHGEGWSCACTLFSRVAECGTDVACRELWSGGILRLVVTVRLTWSPFPSPSTHSSILY